jgi:hypothetical protein
MQEAGCMRQEAGAWSRQTCYLTAGLEDIRVGLMGGRDLVHWKIKFY